jgi:hypothetical protein
MTRTIIQLFITTVVLFLLPVFLEANVVLPILLSDGMILQRDTKIIVWCDEIKDPIFVRYAWADNPEGANLYNIEGLPASPFEAGQNK